MFPYSWRWVIVPVYLLLLWLFDRPSWRRLKDRAIRQVDADDQERAALRRLRS